MREQSGSEVTVLDIDDLQDECVRETEDGLNMRLLQNHKEVNKGCSRKNNSPVWAFTLQFRNVACDDGAICYYCTLCHFVDPGTQWETTKGVANYMKKKTPSYGTMFFMGMQMISPVS